MKPVLSRGVLVACAGFLLCSACWRPPAPHAGAPASPLSGVGSNPLASPLQFEDSPGHRLVFECKEGSDRLHWQYCIETPGSRSRVVSGEGVAPEERFAYSWHPETRTLWFATPRLLQRVAFTENGMGSSWSSSTPGQYQNDPDLPPEFRAHLAAILAP